MYTDGVEATRLFPTNFGANAVNNKFLAELPHRKYEFTGIDDVRISGELSQRKQAYLQKHLAVHFPPSPNFFYPFKFCLLIFQEQLQLTCQARETLMLKFDAQVMLIRNLSGNLVNGSQGKIVGFVSR